ncbi:MAG: phosphopantothenoylcysteine decarboxylase, partial [Thermodesulfobacteriota bacterium]
STEKIKKSKANHNIALAQNQDILKTLGETRKQSGQPTVLIGFAAESHNLVAEGQRKLAEKNLDLLVVNDITADDAGFEVETNRVIILDRDGAEEKLPLLSKEATANLIWNRAVKLLSD